MSGQGVGYRVREKVGTVYIGVQLEVTKKMNERFFFPWVEGNFCPLGGSERPVGIK